MQARLRLVPVNPQDAEQSAEQALASIMTRIFHESGFTELQRAITRQTECLAKANRSALVQHGWIA